MPTYEYECEECRQRFDVFQSITAKPLARCPKCKGKVRRLIGAGAGFIFKGTGFYLTDYRSENYKKRAKEDKGVKTTAEGTKPESKSDAASKGKTESARKGKASS